MVYLKIRLASLTTGRTFMVTSKTLLHSNHNKRRLVAPLLRVNNLRGRIPTCNRIYQGLHNLVVTTLRSKVHTVSAQTSQTLLQFPTCLWISFHCYHRWNL